MKSLGFAKHIIESQEKAELYAILVINEHYGTARLDYFNKGLLIDDLDGFEIFAEEMNVLANEICKSKNVELITF